MMKENLGHKETQDIVSYWLVKTGIFTDQTIFETYAKLEEETEEVYEELVEPVDKEKLALEIADVIFTCYILAIQSGIDVNEAMFKQLDKQFTRYNPYKAEKLVNEGMKSKEALVKLKKEANASSSSSPSS